MSSCGIGHLLLAVLCIFRIQCGESISASLDPIDPEIQVGSSLTLSCTLHHGKNENRSSQSIQWRKGSTPIPASQYTTPNASTSLLHLHNVTIEDAGKYYCQFKDDDDRSRRPGVHVFIGTPPQPVDNITCEAPTLTTFWCTWDNRHHATTNLAVTDTLEFKPYNEYSWRTCRNRPTEQNRCEASCQDCYDTFEIRVVSSNVLGKSLSEQSSFYFEEIIRPNPVTDLSVTALVPGCLTASWQDPVGWMNGSLSLTYSIRYRDLDHPTLDSQWTEEEYIFSKHYTLCDLRSYSTYEVMVSSSTYFNQNDMKTWSKHVTERTLATAPSAAPRNLTLNESSENPNWISVTWFPVDPMEENGIIFGYMIYSCELNGSYPHTYVGDSVRSSRDSQEWASHLCLDETIVENITVTTEEQEDNPLEYTLINSEAGQSYLVWVSAVNTRGEGPTTEPEVIALPIAPESSKRKGRTGAMIVSAITLCQVMFIIGLGLCCWHIGINPFKKNPRLPQPYIPPEVLAMKKEALTPRPPCSSEYFNEIHEFKEDKSLLEDHPQRSPTMVSNSGGSSVDHGFYDMQSSSSNSGSGTSSCSSSQFNSSNYHDVSTLGCRVKLTSNKQVLLMKDPETGYSVATPAAKCGITPEKESMEQLLINNGNYDIEEADEEDEDSYGYVNPNDVEPGTVGVSRLILKGNVYDQPTKRIRFQSSQSDTPTVLTSSSDQGFGSADSDPDSRQVSPTETTSPMFTEFIPSNLDMLHAHVDLKDRTDYFGLDEIESICSSMASSRYRSSNGDNFPYNLPQYRRKSKSSNKSFGSESDIFSGYMCMSTKEESDTDYGYVSKDQYGCAQRGDEITFLPVQEQTSAMSTYDASDFYSESDSTVNERMKTVLVFDTSPVDILSEVSRLRSTCIKIPNPSCPSSTTSSPCTSVASSPNSSVSEVPSDDADRQIILARDVEEDSSNDQHRKGGCVFKNGHYVSHEEASEMSAIHCGSINPETISKEIPPGSSPCRVSKEDNPPMRQPQRQNVCEILVTDPVSGYVRNAVFS
ncbi:uncharacterized protein LOC129257543 [Lytechinus pictus]|uniref:uncharacterized protein LOC129257543 n=1 Tax=Lytechinus pictus TaxID=7653 RepID=UPI0030B9EC72